jgi:competence protein ComEC
MVVQNDTLVAPRTPFTGLVVTNPVSRSYGQSFELVTDNHAHVLIQNRTVNMYVYGDVLRIDATCKKPKNFETDLGSTFNYITYLKKDHIYFICQTENIDFIKHKKSIVGRLYYFSNYIAGQIERTFSSPHNAFIGGVLVGDKTNISNSIRNDFIKTGTIHIIALSGYNIAIIALFFQYIFIRLFRKKIALLFSGIAIIIFVAMTGFMASAIRAGLMALVLILAQLTYQKYSPLRALLFVSCMMVLYDPFYLFYDSSFHLSFLATYGVIVVSPIYENYLIRLKNRTLRSTLSMTLGAYIMTLPYLLYFFEGLSLIGIIANMIILPVIPVFMFMGAIALGMSFLSLELSFIPSTLTEYISQGILSCIHFFARIPYGYIPIHISASVCIGLYAIIFYWIYTRKKVDLES